MRYYKGLQKKGADGRTNWALMASFDIPCEGRLYLRRLRIIETPWFGVFLHEMHGPDADRDLHDHPYDFYSVILKGGYIESLAQDATMYGIGVKVAGKRHWPRWSGHLMKKEWGHRIVELLRYPTYTLIFHGPRTREWGFWTDKGWIKWNEYHEQTDGERAV